MGKGSGSKGKGGAGGTAGSTMSRLQQFDKAGGAAAEAFASDGKSVGGGGNLDAVRAYTGAHYKSMNELLRSGYREYANLHSYDSANATMAKVRATYQALRTAQKAGATYSGKVMRGLTLKPSQLTAILATGKFSSRAFMSTTISKNTAKTFTGNVKLHINQKNGVAVGRISKYKAEREVILMPGSQFKVTRSRVINGVTHIHLRQTR